MQDKKSEIIDTQQTNFLLLELLEDNSAMANTEFILRVCF